jgi:cell wall-associated NlpC family hydrolase
MNSLRDEIIKEALSWVGTPFHWSQSVKGQGCDCGGFLIGVFKELGLVPESMTVPVVPHGIFYHKSVTIYEDLVAQHCYRIDFREALPADILLFILGKSAAHGAIYLPDNKFISCVIGYGVVVLDLDDKWVKRLHSAWRYKGLWSQSPQ